MEIASGLLDRGKEGEAGIDGLLLGRGRVVELKAEGDRKGEGGDGHERAAETAHA